MRPVTVSVSAATAGRSVHVPIPAGEDRTTYSSASTAADHVNVTVVEVCDGDASPAGGSRPVLVMVKSAARSPMEAKVASMW